MSSAHESIGTWSTIAGINPGAAELVEAADEILGGEATVSEVVARSTMQFVWRRQNLPHSSEWKLAEKRCMSVLRHVREGRQYDGGY